MKTDISQLSAEDVKALRKKYFLVVYEKTWIGDDYWWRYKGSQPAKELGLDRTAFNSFLNQLDEKYIQIVNKEWDEKQEAEKNTRVAKWLKENAKELRAETQQILRKFDDREYFKGLMIC